MVLLGTNWFTHSSCKGCLTKKKATLRLTSLVANLENIAGFCSQHRSKETSIIICWRSYIFLKQALSQLQDLTSVIQLLRAHYSNKGCKNKTIRGKVVMQLTFPVLCLTLRKLSALDKHSYFPLHTRQGQLGWKRNNTNMSLYAWTTSHDKSTFS